MKVCRDVLAAAPVLGGVVAVFPDAILVAPDGHDKKKGIYPSVLWGRRPESWMSGSSERKHQRAAWSILLAGLKQAGIPFAVAPDGAPPSGVDVGDLAAVVAAIRLRLRTEKSSLALLIDTTFKTRPELTGGDLVDLALAAAQQIKQSKDPAALRVRLAAALDSLNADTLV